MTPLKIKTVPLLVLRRVRSGLFRIRKIIIQKSWKEISASDYRIFHAEFGGSLHFHPDFVEVLEELRGIPVIYRGYFSGKSLVAALPMWPEGIVGIKDTVDQISGRRALVDVGDAELAFPIDASKKIPLRIPGHAAPISSLHVSDILDLSPCEATHMLGRGHIFGSRPLSKSTLSKHRGDLNRFLRAGGIVRSVGEFSAGELAEMYRSTYLKQRNCLPVGNDQLERVFSKLVDLLMGSFYSLEILLRQFRSCLSPGVPKLFLLIT